jgi:hypothetical protein
MSLAVSPYSINNWSVLLAIMEVGPFLDQSRRFPEDARPIALPYSLLDGTARVLSIVGAERSRKGRRHIFPDRETRADGPISSSPSKSDIDLQRHSSSDAVIEAFLPYENPQFVSSPKEKTTDHVSPIPSLPCPVG